MRRRSSGRKLAHWLPSSRLLAFTGAAYGLYLKAFADAGPLPLEEAKALSVTVVDRDDRLLRAFTTTEGKWRLPLEPKDVDPHYLKMLFAFEDKRFYSHHGIDPKAVVRAVLQMVRARAHRLRRLDADDAGRSLARRQA